MSKLTRLRQQQLLREAEGYLELVVAFDDKWPLDVPERTHLADRTLDCLKRIEDQRGKRAHILYLKGQAYRISDRLELAIEALEHSWKLDSRHVFTCLALASCYRRLGQYGNAIETLQQALIVDPNCATAHYNLACQFARLNQTKMAMYHLQAALELNSALLGRVSIEPDFDGIRNDPDFLSTTSVIV